jgi:AcrR family transcriptional regulator
MSVTSDTGRGSGSRRATSAAPPTASARPHPRRRRADAERSIAAITEAGLALLSRDPDVSMTAIARAAGVGRVTLYSHFPSRGALLEAVVERAITDAGAALAAERRDELPALEALRRLLRTSWRIVEQHRGLYEAAVRELGPRRLRPLHALVLTPIEQLITRGRDEGAIRADLPVGWLVATVYALLHATAEELNGGRLSKRAAADVLETTVLAALEARNGGNASREPARASARRADHDSRRARERRSPSRRRPRGQAED